MAGSAATVIDQHPNVIVVHVQAERLDEANLTSVRDDTVAAGTAAPGTPVVLDMAKVAYIASMSLGGLVQLVQVFRARRQRLVLAALQPFVREAIAITRLDRLFEVVDKVSDVSEGI
jgi:anti-anti-sigma factor